ncbi:hypothetical protein FNF28_05092 [Cafeteria roenbergensis]|uniref:GHMP kinase N-terminal domain-containing protein n=1 Tax=Cafeteria roenbergensis TaxID=33653 RepID=A0A5A8D9V5_CAFRO|nr:hypothetical protein FNF28_05092 [Cafeteria roenbergensis]
MDPSDVVTAEAFARVGLMGNPSDGFFGRTVAATISNFKASVTVWPDRSPAGARGRVTLAPHPVFDAAVFANVAQASAWHTTIPRQVGLAGSSAILTAFVRAMLAFWGLAGRPELLEKAGLGPEGGPSFVLAVETEELGISAGLQDRVAQWWGGVVAMDFARERVEASGAGVYRPLPVAALPGLFLAYAPDPSDSGRIHAPVRQRWLEGDAVVTRGMCDIAACAAEVEGMLDGPVDDGAAMAERGHSLAELMSRNFGLRRSLFGDASLGRANLRMVEIAVETGAAAKFPGSGGAVVGVVDVVGMAAAGSLAADAVPGKGSPMSDYDLAVAAGAEALRRAYAAEGFVCVMLRPTA